MTHSDLRPAVLHSRLLSDAGEKYATHAKEAITIFQALQFWRCYLHEQKVIVYTVATPFNQRFITAQHKGGWCIDEQEGAHEQPGLPGAAQQRGLGVV